MGLCTSCEAGNPVTAKVILNDGKLREYSRPVKAAQVLKEGSAWFLCDADVMDFHGFVSPVDSGDNLLPGQLYFILPVTMLRKPLQVDQIAALVAKASTALVHAAPTSRSRYRRRSALVFAEASVTQKKTSGKRLKGFATSLSIIPE